MAPMAMSSSEGSKSSKMIVKRLWNKLMTPKQKITKDKPDNDLEFDSVPDFEKKTNFQPGRPRNIPVHSEETKQNRQHLPETDEEFTKDEEFPQGEGKRGQKESETLGNKAEDSKNSPSPIVYNFNAPNGTFHWGNTISQTYNIQQNINKGTPKKKSESAEKKGVRKTPQIEAVLQSKVKLNPAHITKLSSHFGNKWRNIGLALEFSTGDLDRIENNVGTDVKQISFEMLEAWIMKNGDQATVGKLSVKLWNSKILNAREAVKVLSDNFSNF